MKLDKLETVILAEVGDDIVALDSLVLSVEAFMREPVPIERLRAAVVQLYDHGLVETFRNDGKDDVPVDPRASISAADLLVGTTHDAWRTIQENWHPEWDRDEP
jgi:hypothetical protein